MTFYRKADVFLIEIDDHYALVDAPDAMVHILNRSAAHAWAHLNQADEAFLQRLWELGLLVEEPTQNEPESVISSHPDPPAIISSTRIQVAAGSAQGDFDEYGRVPEDDAYGRPLFDDQGSFDAYGRPREDDEYGNRLF